MRHGIRRLSWLLGLAALALAGCFQNNVDSSYSLDGTKGSGVLVASLGRSGATNFNMTLTIRNMQSGKRYFIPIDEDFTTKDFGQIEKDISAGGFTLDWGHATQSNPLGRLVVLDLPAGDYQVRGFKGDAPRFATQSADRYLLNSDPVDAQFTIKVGQVTYLGSLVIAMPDSIYYEQPKGTFHVVVGDARERDAKLLQGKYPRLAETLPAPSLTNVPESSHALNYYYLSLPDGGQRSG